MTVFTPIPAGTDEWDVPLNAALTAIDIEASSAQTSATAAQATANTAVTNAATAQSAANAAQTTANTGVANAAAAQTTANTAVTNAAAAQTTANTGVTNAAAAQTTANTAVTNAATAQTTANTAETDAQTGLTRTAGTWRPALDGAISWAYDPVAVTAGQTGTAGTLYLVGMQVDTSVTATKIFWGLTTAGVTPTAGQNFVGLYNSAGTRLANVGVDAKVTVANSLNSETISVALTPGLYWVALLFNAATMPSLFRAGFINGTVVNFNLAFASSRFGTAGTGLTALPATITPASITQVMSTYWSALA